MRWGTADQLRKNTLLRAGRTALIPELDSSRDELVTQLAGDVAPLPGFASAAGAVLDYLRSTYGLALWMVSRTAGDHWVVLAAAGDRYAVAAGDVLCWSDSLCSRMVHGQGPRVAPRAMGVPAYADAPLARQFCIGTYVGIPLTGPTGELFGTICAVDPEPSPESLVEAQPLFELQARLLSSLLAVELTADQDARRADLASQRGRLDLLTGALDRSGWEDLLRSEQTRCRRLAAPTTVIVLDVNAPADRKRRDGEEVDDVLLIEATRIVTKTCRPDDVIGRTGLNEVAVLCLETPEAVGQRIATRLQQRLARDGIVASVGVAAVDARTRNLTSAWERAAAAKDEEKACAQSIAFDRCCSYRRANRAGSHGRGPQRSDPPPSGRHPQHLDGRP